MARAHGSTDGGDIPRLKAEIAASERQERVAALVREYSLYSDDKLGFLWYAEPGRRGIIECVRWQRALTRNLTA